MLKLKKLRNSNQGFTIIEVLIVLAIAALILLIVFLAVPALQRNARNTQRKNDVASILGGVNEFITNNGGTAPTKVTISGNTLTWDCVVAPCTSAQTKVGYYNGVGAGQGQVELINPFAAKDFTGAAATSANDRVAIVVIGANCNNTNAVAAGASRGIAAEFEIENGGTTYAGQCQSS